MKKNLLKAGELYAVRNEYQSCLLLDTAVHLEHSRTRGATSYSPAADHKPGRDPSKSWGFGIDRRNYGFLMLSGTSSEALAAVDTVAAYESLLATGRLSEGSEVSVKLVTSLAAILGPYEEVRAQAARQQEAERARQVAREERRRATVARLDAVVCRFNKALGSELIDRVLDDGYSERTGVNLTLAQAEALADLLDARNPGSEA
jgi:hypothetical protein